MIRIAALTLAAACSLGSAPAVLAAQTPARQVIDVDRIVAIVNDEVITRVELQSQLQLAIESLKRQGTPLPPREVLEKQVLERIIAQKAQLQFAKENGIRVDEVTLDRTVAHIAKENKLTLEQLRAALKKDGIAFDTFREEMRKEVILARLREREVDSKLVVSEAEIDAFLQNRETEARNDEYHLGHILVRVPEQASPEQIQEREARAQQALAELKKGSDFGQVAATYSDAPEGLKGGLLGWREANRLPSLFLDALKGLRVGEVTSILRSPNGFHILKLVDQRAPRRSSCSRPMRATSSFAPTRSSPKPKRAVGCSAYASASRTAAISPSWRSCNRRMQVRPKAAIWAGCLRATPCRSSSAP
jgi:peptidyl-prolyl cis-trans isomerase SurA